MKYCKCCEKHFISSQRGKLATVCDQCFNNTTHGRMIELAEYCNALPDISFNKLCRHLRLNPSDLLHLFITAKNRYQDAIHKDHNALISAESLQQIILYINNHEQELEKQFSQFSTLKNENVEQHFNITRHPHSKLVDELKHKVHTTAHNPILHAQGEHPTHHVSGTREFTISGRNTRHHKIDHSGR